MREVGKRFPDGEIFSLGYTDIWGEREYLYTMTDLCDRAGCHCVGNEVVCDNWEYRLFMPDLHSAYLAQCLQRCECFEEDSSVGVSTTAMLTDSEDDTESVSSEASVNNYATNWAAQNAQKMQEVYSPRPDPNGTENGRVIEQSAPPVVGTLPARLTHGKPCLAGQAGGWVFQNRAAQRCCPGYDYTALTASQAYVNYGLPIDYIVAGASVGMCLKALGGSG